MNVTHILASILTVVITAQVGMSTTTSDSFDFGSLGAAINSGTSTSGNLNLFDTTSGALVKVEARLELFTTGGSGQGESAAGSPAAMMDFNSTLTVAFDPNTTGPILRDTGFGQLSLTNTTTITDVVVPGAGGSSGIQSFSSISNDTGWVEVNSTFFDGYESFGPGMFTVTNAGPVGGGVGNAGNSNF